MQNEDEELRGLEEKLGRLIPRDMDESHLKELVASLEQEGSTKAERRNGEVYPPNVLWMRFAPVAAAAGVVLLGTFLLRYESRMGALQAQHTDAIKMSGGAVNVNDSNTVSPAVTEVEGSMHSGLASFPVPRLGVREVNGVNAYSLDAGILPASGQNYLQPAGEVFSDLNRNDRHRISQLHFEDAYNWQEGEGQVVEEESSSQPPAK